MKKTFEKFAIGTAERVIAHAAYKKSRGKNPSMGFLTVNNPRDALVKATEFVKMQNSRDFLENAIVSVGGTILESCGERGYEELSREEVIAAVHHIVATSSDEHEVTRRMMEELGCPIEPHINVLRALSRIGEEAKALCKAMGGITLKTGELVQMMIWGPRGDLIMI